LKTCFESIDARTAMPAVQRAAAVSLTWYRNSDDVRAQRSEKLGWFIVFGWFGGPRFFTGAFGAGIFLCPTRSPAAQRG